VCGDKVLLFRNAQADVSGGSVEPHSGVTLPPLAAIFFSLRRVLRRVLRLGLRVADSFGQHLAQLGLRPRSLACERFLPLGHALYMGMPEGN
jgi:hypothetical protein